MSKVHIARVAAVVAFLVLGTTLARAADRPDAWITMSTKVSLMTADGVSTKDLNVDTVKGVVTLHGMVATEAEKTKAGEVARKVDGVKDVKNMLQVVPKAKRDVVERADDEIKKGVEDAFKANKAVNDSGIKVASVNKGVVLLSGKTKSVATQLEAIQLADAVKGVRRVSSEVQLDE